MDNGFFWISRKISFVNLFCEDFKMKLRREDCEEIIPNEEIKKMKICEIEEKLWKSE